MFRFFSVLVISLSVAFTPLADASVRFPWSKSKGRSTANTAAGPSKTQSRTIARVRHDTQRLESLLAEVKTSAKLSDKSWKSVANEADMLAKRIYTNVKSATAEKNALRAAEELRTHVGNMKKEADQRDYRNTRRHAERALSVAARLDEWAG
ncbi:MAG: hypothetical protein NVSMB68_11130 [Thermoanaerobaculia bacterium]